MSDPTSDPLHRHGNGAGTDVEGVRTMHSVRAPVERSAAGGRDRRHPSRDSTRIAVRAGLPCDGLPVFLTVDETADLLRTTRKAVYSMVERGQLSGVTRIGRRLLIRTRDLLSWLDHNCAPSP